MSRYTKYKLYQKYETRGSQEAIPCYPNVFSIDGDGTMPLVIVEEQSRDCGYTGDTQPIYRWYTLPIESYYYCDDCQTIEYRWVDMDISTYYECVGTTKYYKQKKQQTSDGGITWVDVDPPQYQMGDVYQTKSPDCGYTEAIYRWVENGYTCIGFDKYVNNIQQVSYDNGQTWQNTTNTSASTLVESDSEYCGVQHRTTSGTPYCEGYDKYVDVYYQKSYDGGSTWITASTTPTMVEHNSSDCGYVPPVYEGQYLTLVAKGDGIIKKTRHSETFQYSRDSGSTWTNATSATSISVNSGDRVMFKGTLTPIGTGVGSFERTTCPFEVEGNPMSLIYGDNFRGQTNLSGKNSAFLRLFSCKKLESIDNLVLPATTLEYRCYWGMFQGCSGLTSIPSDLLPATTLGEYCYTAMFMDCSGLTSVPSSLLPATTLANSCYASMFYGCTSLITAPDLLATTLEVGCYGGMFVDCSSLNYVKCLATDLSAEECTDDWLYGVSSSGTFVKASSMSGWPSGIDGIPNNWTVQNA